MSSFAVHQSIVAALASPSVKVCHISVTNKGAANAFNEAKNYIEKLGIQDTAIQVARMRIRFVNGSYIDFKDSGAELRGLRYDLTQT